MYKLVILFLCLLMVEAKATTYEVVATSTVENGMIKTVDRQIVHGIVKNYIINGVQDVYDYGKIYNTTITGVQNIYNGGASYDTMIKNGLQNLYGGSAQNTILENGNLNVWQGDVDNVLALKSNINLYNSGNIKGNLQLIDSSINVIGNNHLDNVSMDNATISTLANKTPITLQIDNLQGNGRINLQSDFAKMQKDLLDIIQGSGNFGLVVVDKSATTVLPEKIDIMQKTPLGAENFYLVGGAVDIGANKYILAEDDNSWYLQKTFTNTDTALIAKDVYATMHSIFYNHLQNLYVKMKDFKNNQQNGWWINGIGRKTNFNLRQNTNTQIEVYGTQLGFDYVLANYKDWQTNIGFGAGYTNALYDFNHRGNGNGDTYSLNLYSVFMKNDFYIDFVLGHYWHKQKIRSYLPSNFEVNSKYHVRAYSFSAETGKKFRLKNDYFIEPQIQAAYMQVSDVNYRTSYNTKVKGEGQDSVMLRAGIKLGKVWKNSEFYISADLMQELDARSKVTVADATFREEIDGCWAKFGLGTNMKINDKMVLYANVGTMLGNNKVKIPIEGNFTMRWEF